MSEIVVLFKEDDKFDESAALANLIETYGQVKEAVVALTESGQKKRKGIEKDAEDVTGTTVDDKDEKDEKVKKVKASETVAVSASPQFLSPSLQVLPS